MVQFPNKRKIARLSRDRNFLLKASLFLVAISLILALAVSLSTQKSTGDHAKPAVSKLNSFSRFASVIRNPGLERGPHTAEDSRFLKRQTASPEQGRKNQPSRSILKTITASDHLDESEKQLLTSLYQGLRVPDRRSSAIEKLTALPENTRFRNEFLGDIYLISKKNDQALAHYLAEGNTFPDARYSQRSALLELWRNQDFAQLNSLLSRPGFRGCLRAGELMPILTDSRNFPGLLRATFQQSLDQFQFPEIFPPLFTALIWSLIFFSFSSVTGRTVTLSVTAFLLGVISACLTLFTLMIQERIQGFTFDPTDSALSQIIYFVAGVGLREEGMKLLCFVPMAIWILPRKNDLEGLILAGMVGLGFASEENFSYFQNAFDHTVVWSRFLTANALHFSLTGVSGYFFFRMLVGKGRGWENFLTNFLIAVTAHGLYDALISMPALESYSVLGLIALALIAYRYFDLLRDHLDIDGLHLRLSPLGVFVLGSAVLLCSTLIFSAGLTSFGQAFGTFAMSVGGMIPLAFAFISRFRDI